MYNVNNKFALKQGGWNACDADTKLEDHTMREIAWPTNDTLYISCTLDLRKEPVILEMPAFDSKYVSLMVTGYDHYVNVPMATRRGDCSKPEKMLIYSAAGKPEGVPEENWLPIPREDLDLNPQMRIYVPDLWPRGCLLGKLRFNLLCCNQRQLLLHIQRKCSVWVNMDTNKRRQSAQIVGYRPFLPLSLSVLFILLAAGSAASQELVPRRWTPLPIGTNFVGAGYAFTWADISFDPVLRIEDAKLKMHTFTLSYLRTFELLDKSARVEFKIPFQDARWAGLLDGKPASVDRSGMADPVVRLAVNLIGSPPLRGREFAKYRAAIHQETIVGVGLVVKFPLGQYYEDKLLNLGSNRFTIRPQLGVVYQRGNWTMEFTGSIWFFTDNNSFFNGQRLEQDPLFTLQGHLIYTFRPGFWASMSGGLGYGAESTIDHMRKDDEQRNVAWSLAVGYSLTRQFGLKVAYVGIRNLSDTGANPNTLITSAAYFW